MVDVGAGAPLVLIPGIQGRWEWMRPSVDALARDNRVNRVLSAGRTWCRQSVRCTRNVRSVRPVSRRSARRPRRGGGDSVRVSYGGLIALRYARAAAIACAGWCLSRRLVQDGS